MLGGNKPWNGESCSGCMFVWSEMSVGMLVLCQNLQAKPVAPTTCDLDDPGLPGRKSSLSRQGFVISSGIINRQAHKKQAPGPFRPLVVI